MPSASPDSANRRLLYRYASALYSYAADAGEENALPKLAYLRGRCGELDEAMRILRGPADSGDKLASVLLTDLLVQHASWTNCAPWPTAATRPPPFA